jgi:hypothetical protein
VRARKPLELWNSEKGTKIEAENICITISTTGFEKATTLNESNLL